MHDLQNHIALERESLDHPIVRCNESLSFGSGELDLFLLYFADTINYRYVSHTTVCGHMYHTAIDYKIILLEYDAYHCI